MTVSSPGRRQDDDWPNRANCRGHDPDPFYLVRSVGAHTPTTVPPEIQQLCDTCQVSAECLRWALGRGEYGIWGGTTENQRKAILRRILRSKCPKCGSDQLRTVVAQQVCLSCGLGWNAIHRRKPGHPERRRSR